MKRWGIFLIVVLALGGLMNATYLFQHIESGTPLVCNIEGLTECNAVAQSKYAYLFGIPIALYGVIFYGILVIVSALEVILFDQFLRRVIQALAFIGVVMSVYFLYVQIAIIHALCVYCLVSGALECVILLLATTALHPKNIKKEALSLEMPPKV